MGVLKLSPNFGTLCKLLASLFTAICKLFASFLRVFAAFRTFGQLFWRALKTLYSFPELFACFASFCKFLQVFANISHILHLMCKFEYWRNGLFLGVALLGGCGLLEFGGILSFAFS
jgi:hypothetical protein